MLLATTQPLTSYADALDEAVADDALLSTLAEALNAYDIDVVHNLNDRAIARGRVTRPRLGRFPDLPSNTLVNSIELNIWETEFLEGEIGGLALISNSVLSTTNPREFLTVWLTAEEQDRQFVTYFSEDTESADKIAAVADAYGYAVLDLSSAEVSFAGNLYATAAQRLAIDSREARRYRTEVTELSYLGERVRRNSNSLFREGGDNRIARNEPSIFLKETLGDEFNQSTIREIIVPGGIAFGESASLPFEVASMQYESGSLVLLDNAGTQWRLPSMEAETAKALFDFVERSEAIQSDAIVDIDEQRRVKISSSLRDTNAGYEILHADTQPFEFVPNLPVTKSVIIDIAVDWEANENQQLGFESDYEVRFLSADNMRIAQTRVALEYEYSSILDSSEYRDSWGRDVRSLRENLDYTGLGDSMGEVANYAGWIALFRKLKENRVAFLKGRYEFMKVDKTGRSTPSRF
ncbi:MAG: hypothetical protein GKR91_03330 [Pseudomonadales bacterium]|nr:hypothetical protein [Pseudomonadales bacterium]